MPSRILFPVILLGFLAAGPGLAAVDDAGKTLAQVCFNCHGLNGNGSINPAWPVLAGQHASYIAKQLADFKRGTRSDPIMSAQAAALSPQNMADLGAFFAARHKINRKAGKFDSDQLEQGKRIYHQGIAASGVTACVGCHGPDGACNAAARIPLLSRQNVPYVIKALKDFRKGARLHDSNGLLMSGIAGEMTDREIRAVAAYVSTLH